VIGGRPEPGWELKCRTVRAHELVVVAAAQHGRYRLACGGCCRAGPQAWMIDELVPGHPGQHDSKARGLDIEPPDHQGVGAKRRT